MKIFVVQRASGSLLAFGLFRREGPALEGDGHEVGELVAFGDLDHFVDVGKIKFAGERRRGSGGRAILNKIRDECGRGDAVVVLGDGKTDRWSLAVVDSGETAEERIAEDEERAAGRGHVERHEGEGARAVLTIDIIVGKQVENLVTNGKTEGGKFIEISAIRVNLQVFRKRINHRGGSREKTGAGVDSDLAVRAKILLLIVEGHVIDTDLPIGLACYRQPKELGSELVLLVAAESDFGNGIVRQIHGEHITGEGMEVLDVINDVEALAHGQILEAKTHDTVKRASLEGAVALLCSGDKADGRATLTLSAKAEIVLIKLTLDFAGTEANRGAVLLVRVRTQWDTILACFYVLINC